jgi:Zn-finger nucleic acid-binding protein
MNCPVCVPAQPLVPTTTQGTLPMHACLSCHGQWMRNADYLGWMQFAGFTPGATVSPEQAVLERDAAVPDTEPRLRRCPDCSYVLARYVVGSGLAFFIDHCRHCAGTWFDAGEWDVLAERGLHDDLLHVFTDEWQRDVHDTRRRERLEGGFRSRMGDDDYARLLEMKAWIDTHPRRPEILAFLQSRPNATAAPG